MMLSRLGNTVTNNDRNKIKRKLHKIVKRENLSDKEKEMIYDDLVKLVETLDKKEKYHDLDETDDVIKGLLNSFMMIMIMIMVITNQYYSKVLLKTAINIMKAEEIKTKNCR